MLRLASKVFVQELAESCFEVMEGEKKDLEPEVVATAERLI